VSKINWALEEIADTVPAASAKAERLAAREPRGVGMS
jgi:hypothetical protein